LGIIENKSELDQEKWDFLDIISISIT
jgi:hypothetical protein